MKNKILIFALSSLLVLSTSACGDQSTAGNGSSQDVQNGNAFGNDGSSQNMPGSSDGSANSSQNVLNGSGTGGFFDLNTLNSFDTELTFSSLTEFYNSEIRTEVENTINEMYESYGIHTFITIEEPDTVIYNYQYTISLSSIGMSHEEMAAVIASNQQEAGLYDDMMNDIKAFQLCGLPVKIIRMNYMDTDGSMVYSVDYTEDHDVSGFPGSSDLPYSSGTTAGTYADLQEWADSEEAEAVIETTNRTLTSTGITFDLAIDGNILIYKYRLPNDSWVSGLSEEEITTTFAPLLESMASTIDTIFTTFTDEYGLTVDAIRFIYYSANGTEIYSKDFIP